MGAKGPCLQCPGAGWEATEVPGLCLLPVPVQQRVHGAAGMPRLSHAFRRGHGLDSILAAAQGRRLAWLWRPEHRERAPLWSELSALSPGTTQGCVTLSTTPPYPALLCSRAQLLSLWRAQELLSQAWSATPCGPHVASALVSSCTTFRPWTVAGHGLVGGSGPPLPPPPPQGPHYTPTAVFLPSGLTHPAPPLNQGPPPTPELLRGPRSQCAHVSAERLSTQLWPSQLCPLLAVPL